jgi:hypothetical protein
VRRSSYRSPLTCRKARAAAMDRLTVLDAERAMTAVVKRGRALARARDSHRESAARVQAGRLFVTGAGCFAPMLPPYWVLWAAVHPTPPVRHCRASERRRGDRSSAIIRAHANRENVWHVR